MEVEMRKSNTVSSFGSLFTSMTAMVSPAHEVITQKPLYSTIPPLKLRPSIGSLAVGLFHQIDSWKRRRAQRKTLAALDERLLDDIGIARHDAAEEAAKPFWIG